MCKILKKIYNLQLIIINAFKILFIIQDLFYINTNFSYQKGPEPKLYKFNYKSNNPIRKNTKYIQRANMEMQFQSVKYYPKKQFLTCKLCNDVFKKPTTLTCGHSFCYFCLYKFMKQNCHNQNTTQNNNQAQNHFKNQQRQHKEFNTEQSTRVHQNSESIPLPLCPTCNSLIIKPIKSYRQNLTLTNLISHAKLKPLITTQSQIFDQQIQNFSHKLLIQIQNPKIQPLPHCISQIKFTTCFIDDILQQSHSSYIIVEWPGFKKSIFYDNNLKISDQQAKYFQLKFSIMHLHRQKTKIFIEHFLKASFSFKQKKKKLQKQVQRQDIMQVYSAIQSQGIQNDFHNSQQYGTIQICKSQEYHSNNTVSIQAFHNFFSYYDTLSNPYFIQQIKLIADQQVLFHRNNSQAMIYCVIRLLKLSSQQRKEIINTFDDSFRIRKINQFIQKRRHLPIEQILNISIPGKYNSGVVFGVIILLFLLHYFQSESN